jgi:hypothetical protein
VMCAQPSAIEVLMKTFPFGFHSAVPAKQRVLTPLLPESEPTPILPLRSAGQSRKKER